MLKFILSIFFTILCVGISNAQSREELERQRQQLRKEIEQTETLLKANKAQTNENLLQWRLINNKVNLQGQIVENINKDINVLDRNIFKTQVEYNKYGKILDTLKQEYAKSMVYAYKNRSNYDFLNFIFSADNFNDAIKRLAYLKSYRTYREMQGQNILRMQELRKQKSNELSGTKLKKGDVLKSQNKELETLAVQQVEKDKVLVELKKQGSKLNTQIAAKQKQMKKVDGIIAAAIRKAIADAKKAQLAKAAEEKKRIEEARRKEAKRLADEERARIAAANKAAAAAPKNNPSVPSTTSPSTNSKTAPTVGVIKPSNIPVKSVSPALPKPVTKPEPHSDLINESNIALNSSFERNRGSLPWPVDNRLVLNHYGRNNTPTGAILDQTCITISASVGTSVKAVFDGTVLFVNQVDELMEMVMVQHGRYFTTYSNIKSVTVKAGQQIRTGQVLGKVAPSLEGSGGSIDFYIANEKSNFDPEKWLR